METAVQQRPQHCRRRSARAPLRRRVRPVRARSLSSVATLVVIGAGVVTASILAMPGAPRVATVTQCTHGRPARHAYDTSRAPLIYICGGCRTRAPPRTRAPLRRPARAAPLLGDRRHRARRSPCRCSTAPSSTSRCRPSRAISTRAAAASIWVINAYQLAILVVLLPLAALGEIVGYRRVSQAGLVGLHARLARLRARAHACSR